MNTDIRLSVGFMQHPKTRKMIKRLGLESLQSLLNLWLWAAQNKPDGKLSGMDWEDIELAADWRGEDRAFFDYCNGVWIDEIDGQYCLHEWQEHNPWQAEAEARSEQARQNARAGWEKRKEKQAQANGKAEAMQPQCNRNATVKQAQANGNAPSPSPSPKPDIKDIEESSRCSDSSCSELSGDTSEPEPVPPDKHLPPPVIFLPVNSGPEYAISQASVDEWQSLYPAVDVMQQLRNMRGWLLASPVRRKTAKGIPRFVNGWLAREQDRGKPPQPRANTRQFRPQAMSGDEAARKTWEAYERIRAREASA